jgi:hypothetical protein
VIINVSLSYSVLFEALLLTEKAKKCSEVYDHIQNCSPICTLQVKLYNQDTN